MKQGLGQLFRKVFAFLMGLQTGRQKILNQGRGREVRSQIVSGFKSETFEGFK